MDAQFLFKIKPSADFGSNLGILSLFLSENFGVGWHTAYRGPAALFTAIRFFFTPRSQRSEPPLGIRQKGRPPKNEGRFSAPKSLTRLRERKSRSLRASAAGMRWGMGALGGGAGANWRLFPAIAFSLGLNLLMVYTPFGSIIFGCAPISPKYCPGGPSAAVSFAWGSICIILVLAEAGGVYFLCNKTPRAFPKTTRFFPPQIPRHRVVAEYFIGLTSDPFANWDGPSGIPMIGVAEAHPPVLPRPPSPHAYSLVLPVAMMTVQEARKFCIRRWPKGVVAFLTDY